jgi:hypothetical protein
MFNGFDIEDAVGGNGDGVISPFETIDMPVTLTNIGGITAHNVVADLGFEVASPYITLINTASDFGDILPDCSSEGIPAYLFSVNGNCPNGETIEFELDISDSAGNNWIRTFQAVVWSPELSFEGLTIDDAGEWRPNGILNASETGNTIISLKNNNAYAHATGLSAVLRTSDAFITVLDSTASFADISPGQTVDNSSDVFVLEASSSLPFDHQVDMELHVTGDNIQDVVDVSFIAGERMGDDPTGPDEYAYWAYDLLDTLYTECPSYNWVEVDPNYGGSGTELVLSDDETEQLALPFGFMYYGTTYDTISICSNGWVALGVTNVADYRYYPMPDPNGPPACVAPYWTNLNPTTAGGVYYRYDTGIHAFIIEWSRIHNEHSDDIETFEIVMYDPVYNPTITGDGEVYCQYHTVIDAAVAGTGIEDETETIGLEFQIGGQYNSGSAPIVDNSVVKFTTDPPSLLGIAESKDETLPKIFALSQNFPNPFGCNTRIAYQIPAGKAVHAVLQIFDASGKVVKTLVNSKQQPGYYVLSWDGCDSFGRGVASGVYFARFAAGDYIKTGKMLYLK